MDNPATFFFAFFAIFFAVLGFGLGIIITQRSKLFNTFYKKYITLFSYFACMLFLVAIIISNVYSLVFLLFFIISIFVIFYYTINNFL